MAEDNEGGGSSPRQGRRSGIDLDSMSVAELTALRDAAEAKRLEKLEDAKNAVLDRARAELAAMGLSFEDVLPGASPVPVTPERRRRSDAGAPVPAKYQGPNGETWSGRGRIPKWLHALEARGRSRNEFAIT